MSKSSTSSIINSSTWSNCSSDNDTSSLAKLRRLRIQEGLLLQNINKIMTKHYDNREDFIMPCASSEYKSYVIHLRNSYRDIKNLFDSVKFNTSSHDALKTYDIDDIKNDITELETKLKQFKHFLLSEQTVLRAEEIEFIKKSDTITESLEKTTKQPKIKSKPFNEIVPSPVKNIISSPFKCQEVQQFQEFLKCHQRYGGWLDYSHNMFTQTWHKYFHNGFDSNLDIHISKIEESSGFINEILDKIPGVTKDDIIQHSKWYIEYLNLKRRQQEALNKWRAKKKIIKKSKSSLKGENDTIRKPYHNDETTRKCKKRFRDSVTDDIKIIEEMYPVELLDDSIVMTDNSDESSSRIIRCSAVGKEEVQIRDNNLLIRPAQELKSEKQRAVFNFAKSTQQWTNMCKDKKSDISNIKYMPQLDDIEKLCVPKWRLHIQN